MVLDDHLRDENAEWRDFGTVEDIARGNVPGKRHGVVMYPQMKHVGLVD